MESRIGCKAGGLGTNILFQDGLPRVETMDTLLRSIDEQLGDTNRQIEACVKSILEMSNGMIATGDQKFYHPGEALKNIGENLLLEKSACYDPETEDVSKLLKHIIQTIQDCPGSEEYVLQQLLQLSSQEGLCLPVQNSAVSTLDHSVMSINTAVNDSESLNEALWTDICMKLRRYFVDKLQNLSSSPLIPEIDLMCSKRLLYVQSLCTLYPAKEIWGKYRSIRSQQYGAQLLTYRNAGLSSTENINFVKGVQHFERLVLFTQAMMQEDFGLLNSGVFGNVVGTMDALSEIYLDKILDEVSAITDSLQGDLSNVTVKPLNKKSSKDTDSKNIHKSTSETASMNQFRGGLRKQQSKSLDSLLSHGDSFTDLQTLPTDVIGMLVRFINCVLNIDTYIQHLRSLMTWELNNVAAKKPQQKRLKSALKARRDPESRMQSKNRPLYIPSDSDMESTGTFVASAIPPGVASQAMMAEMTASLREKQASEKKLWDWQSIFVKLSSDLSKCIEQKIAAVSEKVLEMDKTSLEKKKCFDMISVSENIIGGRLDYPLKVSQGIGGLFEEMDELLVLAKAFADGPVQIIRSAFIDCLSTTVKTVYTNINKVVGEVNSEYSVDLWYQCLANAAFMRNHLLYYETILGVDDHGNSKKILNSLYKQYCDLVEQISKQVIDYQTMLLSTTILHDAESHNWEDSKDFYEGERCSFDIQMWNLHMKALEHDLWFTCPPLAAQNIYTTTLRESLNLFELRYSQAKPSYKRTLQVKCDITAILLCTSQLLMPACNHIGMYLDPNANQKHVYSIHNSCCTLLSILAVVTSPLETFYKVFKKGFKKRHSRSGEAQLKLYMSHWLSWMTPDVFTPGKYCSDDLQTTTALYIQLKLLMAQPGINWGLLLESFIMKDFTLPIMLLTQIAKQSEAGLYAEENWIDPPDDSRGHILQLFSDFFDTFAVINGFPEGLSKIMLPVFERTDTWDLLDNTTSLGRSHPIPPWIQVILNCLKGFTKRIIEPGVKVLLQKAEEDFTRDTDPIINVLQDLPCGCSFANLKSADTPRKTSGNDELLGFALEEESSTQTEHKEVMAEAMYSIITQMNDDIYMLPTPLIMFFKALQDQINQKGLHSPHDCVAIKFLATSLRISLIDTELIESWLGLSLSEDVKDSVRMLAECTYHVLTATSYGKSTGVPRMATLFMKANRNWLSEQVELLSDHFSNDIFELPESPGSLHGATEDYTEQLMLSVLSQIQNTQNGLKQLRNCYNVVRNNFDWIIDQLDIPPLLGNKGTPKSSPFKLTLSKMEEEPLNPIVEYGKIGNANFDQALLTEFEYNWSGLLQSDLGLSEVGMKTLLFHRHEMQEGAYLEEQEKKPVEVLKKKFEYESSELV